MKKPGIPETNLVFLGQGKLPYKLTRLTLLSLKMKVYENVS
jgi:hypothetical protein